MNKHQLKQIEMVKAYLANGMIDTASRSVSALIRSATGNKGKNALIQFAIDHNLTNNANFII